MFLFSSSNRFHQLHPGLSLMENQVPKTPDGLLAYHGRPSLFYPAVRTENDDEVDSQSGFPSRLASGMGTAKFLCGACLALLGGMAVYVQAWSAWMYGGIWSGLFAIFTGLCIILTARKHKPQRKSLLVALLVLSVLGFFNTGLLATFTAMGLVAEVYMEDVAGALVWRGVENASPFVVQLLLLATATADCLLSLACCVISGREVCCCGRPTPAVVHSQRRDRLISWLGSQQGTLPPQKVLNLPTVKLVPSTQKRPTRAKTPSTMRVFPPGTELNDSPPSSSSGEASTHNINVPLVKADKQGKRRGERRQREDPQLRRHEQGPPLRPNNRIPEPMPRDVNDSRQNPAALDEKYFALDKKLSEEFIDRTWNF
ncbi:uncharacterized protein TNIN_335871 [Trichonephila inaurata madagascariensis]|uniref:Transmembrane protein n=1 Tax=Trichonephila inaurata madagascariensis TaxID=2747483 RepID=A0A8X7CBQ4_9ARAC|nr:uncharacterized protein TNIN_335871 [Trichonephila inaurata madagascariensis]